MSNHASTPLTSTCHLNYNISLKHVQVAPQTQNVKHHKPCITHLLQISFPNKHTSHGVNDQYAKQTQTIIKSPNCFIIIKSN